MKDAQATPADYEPKTDDGRTHRVGYLDAVRCRMS
jgi:hypothetical protein